MRDLVSLKPASIALALVGAILASPLDACTTPVFRYALQLWEADPYEVTVLHRGPLSEQDQSVLDWLKWSASREHSPANLNVQTVDLSGRPGQSLPRLCGGRAPPEMPWMVVGYPRKAPGPRLVWSGPLSQSAAEALVDSPKRREIARHISEGDSAVWVLVESGSEERDEAAARLLKTQLSRMGETLELRASGRAPAATGGEGNPNALGLSDTGTPASGPPLRISFSLIRLSRSDRAEQAFLNMLLRSESDLGEYADDPIVFPVLGRGRVLYALVGRGISEANIEEACRFLAGPCLCQIKAENAGTDLLMAVNWDSVIAAELAAGEEPPPLTSFAAFRAATDRSDQDPVRPSETEAAVSMDSAPEVAPASGRPAGALARNMIILALLGLGAVAVGTLVLRSKRRRP